MGYHVNSLFFPYYGSFISLGIIVACLVGVFQTQLFGNDVNDFFLLTAIASLGGMIGAKCLYFLVSYQSIDFSKVTDFSYINSLMQSGFVFYDGLIGGAMGLFMVSRWLKLETAAYIRVCIPCLPIAHGFGRIGCSAVGCCYGIPFTSVLSVTYRNSPFAPNNIAFFPIQLTEAVGNFVIGAILLIYIDILKRDKGVFLYIALYAPIRFALEFFRNDTVRGHVGFLSVSQWISILLILVFVLVGFACFPSQREFSTDNLKSGSLHK